MKKILLLLVFSLVISFNIDAQVLISLLLGDKLNSDKIEFGLVGGANIAHSTVPEASTAYGSLSLGFYFNILLNEKWSIAPSVAVISSMGASGIAAYPVDPTLDDALVGAEVTRKIEYFQVPIFMRYKFSPRFYGAIGPQFGLRHKATDEFVKSLVSEEDLVYNNDIRDQYTRLDAGFSVGLGYRLKKDIPKAMSVGVQFYHGLVDVLKDNPGDPVYNKALLLYVTVPIGAGKKKNAESSPE
ncbi:MAG: PorT family protein [Reichenbachiella sp.]